MERNFILGSIVVGAVACAAAVSLKNNDAREVSANAADSQVPRIESTPAPEANASVATPERRQSSPIEERRDDALLAHVEHKYRYLLADVESGHIDELKRRLLALESDENTATKATTDAYVREMLSPREREYYEVLKDSDVEQHHVAEYVGGIGNVAPLDQQQERQILDAKLRQKERYETVIRDSGLDRETLSAAERAYARAQVAQALASYRDEFLMAVQPSLTSEQYTLLRNYETTEFEKELERLQRQINAK